MKKFFTTLFILLSASAMAVLCILPYSRDLFPLSIIAAGAHIGDTLFHEMGHTVFNWLFGHPAIPMIFTLFGADQAGGMSMAMDRKWVIQVAAFVLLAFFCYQLKEQQSKLLIPAMLFSAVIFYLAFTPYYRVIILYMGHGGAIAVGSWLLYRGCLYLDARNQFERWLNAFLGLFLILHNFYFSYDIAFNAESRAAYSEHVAFGIADNDFQAIADQIWRWSVKGIAIFTMGYCCVAIIGAIIFAICRRKDFGDYEEPLPD